MATKKPKYPVDEFNDWWVSGQGIEEPVEERIKAVEAELASVRDAALDAATAGAADAIVFAWDKGCDFTADPEKSDNAFVLRLWAEDGVVSIHVDTEGNHVWPDHTWRVPLVNLVKHFLVEECPEQVEPIASALEAAAEKLRSRARNATT